MAANDPGRPRLRKALHVAALSLAISFFSASAAAQDLAGLYLTWTQDPSTTITINWVDLYPKSTNAVWYRQAGAQEWRSAEATHSVIEPSTLQRRYLQLEGLKPDTLYQFAITERPDPAKPDEGWIFRTMPADLNRRVRFVTGGDMMRDRAMLDAMSSRVKSLEPDFAMFGGDLAYENGAAATRIIDFLQSWKEHGVGKNGRLIPVVAVIGNHEVRGGYGGKVPDDAPYFYGLYRLPGDRSYCALDFGTYLSLVLLDSGHTNPIAGKQASWLAGALAERTRQTYLFACYHYPAYGTTKAPEGEGKLPIDAERSIEIRQNWTPLFDRYGVSAVFENDHHNFKRTHRLRGHRRDDDNGILYLGDGAWGVTTREVPDPSVGWWLAKAEPRNHLWIVDLIPGADARIRAMDPQGKIFDKAQLPAPRTRPVP
jgi:hypothetical protein